MHRPAESSLAVIDSSLHHAEEDKNEAYCGATPTPEGGDRCHIVVAIPTSAGPS